MLACWGSPLGVKVRSRQSMCGEVRTLWRILIAGSGTCRRGIGLAGRHIRVCSAYVTPVRPMWIAGRFENWEAGPGKPTPGQCLALRPASSRPHAKKGSQAFGPAAQRPSGVPDRVLLSGFAAVLIRCGSFRYQAFFFPGGAPQEIAGLGPELPDHQLWPRRYPKRGFLPGFLKTSRAYGRKGLSPFGSGRVALPGLPPRSPPGFPVPAVAGGSRTVYPTYV